LASKLQPRLLDIRLNATTTVNTCIAVLKKGSLPGYGVISHDNAFCGIATGSPGAFLVRGLDGVARGSDGISVFQP
jgi:hypothetical protein